MKTKRIISILLVLAMALSLFPVTAFAEEQTGFDNFKKVSTLDEGKLEDVNSTDWFCENAKIVYELGLMVGRGESEFAPDENITVAESMTIAARLNSIYKTGKAEFAKTEPWYKAYTDYCKANGIADIANYEPNALATRGQFADIFANALPKEALGTINEIKDGAIPDVKEGDAFANAVYALYRAGILVGNDDKGTFASNTNIKRSEVSAIASRMAVPAQRQKITLKVEGAEYTVSFDLGYDDKTLNPVKVNDGEKVTAPTNPTRSGYTFAGWYTEKTGGTKFNFNKAITEDTTLYAHWNKKSSGGGSKSKTLKTIAEVLATVSDFPVSTSWEIPAENSWTAENGFKCYKLQESIPEIGDRESLAFNTDDNDLTVFSMDINAPVTKSGNSYVFGWEDHKITFNMKDNKLESIVLEGLTDERAVFNGKTFTAPKAKTLAEIIATNSDFPKSADLTPPANPWVNKENAKGVAYLSDFGGGHIVLVNLDPELVFLIPTIEKPTKDGSNYVLENGDRKVTFYMEGGKITSFKFESKQTDLDILNGTYSALTETKTLAEILATNSDFPKSEDASAPANAWVNESNSDCKAFIGVTNEQELLFFKKPGLSNYNFGMNEIFTKVGDNYVIQDVIQDAYVKTTLIMEDGKVVSAKIETTYPEIMHLNGTYSVLTETKTLAEILATNPDIPTSENSIAPEGAWVNGNDPDSKGFVGIVNDNECFSFKNSTTSFSVETYQEFTKVGDDYVRDGYNKYTCHMKNGKVVAIQFEAGNSTYESLNGTYAPEAETITFAELMAKQTDFPTTDDTGWVNPNITTAKMYLNSNNLYINSNSWVSSDASLTQIDVGYEYKWSATVTFTFNMDGDTLTSIEISGTSAGLLAGTYAPAEEEGLTDGYYLVGKLNGVEHWTVDKVTSAMKLEANEIAPGEYMIAWTFYDGDEIKVVKVESGAITTWYNATANDNYNITASNAGEGTLYFNPDGDEAWTDYQYIYIEPKQAPATTYTVIFDPNGATFGTMDPQEFVYGVEQKLRKNTYARPRYTFVGWHTDKNAKAPLYTDEQLVSNLTATDKGTVTLYAVLVSPAIISYLKKPNTDIMGTVSKNTETINNPFKDKASGCTAKPKSGFHFLNWTDADGNVVGTDAKFVPSKSGERYQSAQYTAHFEPDEASFTTLQGFGKQIMISAQYMTYNDALTFATQKGGRLPTRSELQSIYQIENAMDPRPVFSMMYSGTSSWTSEFWQDDVPYSFSFEDGSSKATARTSDEFVILVKD